MVHGTRKLIRGNKPKAELRSARHNLGAVLDDGDRHGAWLQGAHDIGKQPSRNDRHAILLASDGQADGDRQVEIGSQQLEAVALELGVDTREYRQGAASGTNCSPYDGEGLHEYVSFAAELHGFILPVPVPVLQDVQ